MSYNFKKLSTVESVETVSDKANVLIEENGVIKKAPKSQVGGASGANGACGAVFIHYDQESDRVVAVTPDSFRILMDGFKNSLGAAVFVLKKWSNNEMMFTPMRVDYIHLDRSDDEHGRYVQVDAETLIIRLYEDDYFSSFWMD